MTLRERQYRPPTNHLYQVLNRLHRENTARSSETSSFVALCDATSIPRDLRSQLLQAMVSQGYVTEAGQGQIRITQLGTKTVVSPLT